MRPLKSFLFTLSLSLSAFIAATTLVAQTSPPPVTFTAEQDHQNMMDQLGIKALRPGPSGNENAPNHANYDESKANPYPNLPDPLTLNDGKKVTTAAMWWDQRRPEIVEMFSKYVYGRVPPNVPKVTWTVTAVDHEMIGFTSGHRQRPHRRRRQLRLSRDQSKHPHDAGHAGERAAALFPCS